MKKKLTAERILVTLIEVKKTMDENDFNSYSFRIKHPEWGALCSILKTNGIVKKNNMKMNWVSIEPNLHMAKKVLSIYHEKSIIARDNYLARQALKRDDIIQEVSDLTKLDWLAEENSSEDIEINIKENEMIEGTGGIGIMEEINKLEKVNFENERLIEIQKDTIAKQAEELASQEKTIDTHDEQIESMDNLVDEYEKSLQFYQGHIDTLEKEFTELKKSINNQNNLFIKPNSKKIKIFGISIYSVEY